MGLKKKKKDDDTRVKLDSMRQRLGANYVTAERVGDDIKITANWRDTKATMEINLKANGENKFEDLCSIIKKNKMTGSITYKSFSLYTIPEGKHSVPC